MSSSQTPPVESAPEGKWWVAKSNKHQGPFSKAKIDAGIRAGQISPTTLICAVGAEEWVAAGEAEQFQANFDNVGSRSGSAYSEPLASALNAAKNVQMPTPLRLTEDRLKSVFRYLLVGEISFLFLGLVLALVGGMMTADYPTIEPPELVGLIQMIAFAIIFLFLLPGLILAWVGLFGFKNWARWLYLGLFALTQILIVPLSVFSYSLNWGLSDSILHLGTCCTGAILALAFLSPLSQCFEKDQGIVDPGLGAP